MLMDKFKWLKEYRSNPVLQLFPKVTFISNKVITEETNVILLSQWYPKYMK